MAELSYFDNAKHIQPLKLGNTNITVDSYIFSNRDDGKWKKAVELYKQGRLFNIVLRGIGTVGNLEISKNRIYSNEAIEEAYHKYKKLIDEQNYYRMMFDSHPTTEDSEDPNMGENNRYEDIAGYILDANLEYINIKGRKHAAIILDFVLVKQQLIDYFMRSVDPVIGISQRGFMAGVQKYDRPTHRNNFNGITYLKEVFESLDFWDGDSDYVSQIDVLRLLGFDIVTYPGDFLCQSTKYDIVGVNVTDTINTNKHVTKDDVVFNYISEEYIDAKSPVALCAMKVNDKLLKEHVKPTTTLDELKFLLKGKDLDMKINKEKLQDANYMFNVLDDLALIFDNMDEIVELTTDNIDEWMTANIKEDYKVTDEIRESISAVVESLEETKESVEEWVGGYLKEINMDALKTIVQLFGDEKFGELVDNGFVLDGDELKTIIADSVDEGDLEEVLDVVHQNLSTMAEEKEYFVGLWNELKDSSDKPEMKTDDEPQDDDSDAGDDGKQEVADASLMNKTDELNEEKWNGDEVRSMVLKVKEDALLEEEDFKALVDEVFGIVRGYEKAEEWKLPHHAVSVEDDVVSVSVSKQGLLAASQALSGARGGVVATGEEKQAAAQHLLRHYEELELEAPENLMKMGESVKFAEVFYETDKISVKLDDKMIEKLIDNGDYFKETLNITNEEMYSILDSIVKTIDPFIEDYAIIELNEDRFVTLAKHLNKFAVDVAKIVNGESVDAFKSTENSEIFNTMNGEISKLRDQVSTLSSAMKSLKSEKEELEKTMESIKSERESLEAKYHEVESNHKALMDKMELEQKKMELCYRFREVLDNDVFTEISGIKNADQLKLVQKWLAKMAGKNKLVVSDIFEKMDIDTQTVTADAAKINKNVVMEDNSNKKNTVIDNIVTLIKSK